jgi:hypothetical protein
MPNSENERSATISGGTLAGANSLIAHNLNGVVHLDGQKYSTLDTAVAACTGTLVVDTPGKWPHRNHWRINGQHEWIRRVYHQRSKDWF